MGSSAYANRCVCFAANNDGGLGEHAAAASNAILSKERTDQFTISWWAAYATPGGYLFGKRGLNPVYCGWSLSLATASTLTLVLCNDATVSNYFAVDIGNGAPLVNVWRHYVITYNGSSSALGVKAYIDGAEITPSVAYNNLTGTIINTGTFWIGGAVNTTPGWCGNSKQTQFAIYDRVLTQAEVTWLYNTGSPRDLLVAGAPSDSEAWWKLGLGDTYPTLLNSSNRVAWPTIPDRSGSGYNGTATNMESTDIVLDVPGGVHSVKSMSFDGVNEYVTMGNVLDREKTDPWSVAFWVKTTDDGFYVVSKFNAASTGYDVGVAYNRANFTLAYAGSTGYLEVSENDVTLNDGNWHHVVAIYTGGGASGVGFVIDGIERTNKTVVNDTLGSYLITNSGPFNINGRTDGTAGLGTAGIDEIAFYSRALSVAEAQWIWNSGVPRDPRLAGAPSGLVGYWPLGEGTGTPVGNLTMTNMEAEDFLNDGPDFFRDHLVTDADVDILSEDEHENLFANGGGGPAPPVTVTYYKLRVRDSLAGPPTVYREWESTSYLSSPPPPDPIGVWIERTILATWVI